MYLSTDYPPYDTIKYSSNTPDILSFNINRRRPTGFLIASLNLNNPNPTKSPFRIPSPSRLKTIPSKPLSKIDLSPERELETSTLPNVQTLEPKTRNTSVKKPNRRFTKLTPIYHDEKAFIRLTSRPRDEVVRTLEDSPSPSRGRSHLLNPDLNPSSTKIENLKEMWAKQLTNLYSVIKSEEKRIIKEEKSKKLENQILTVRRLSVPRRIVKGYGDVKEREGKQLSNSFMIGGGEPIALNRSAEFLHHELRRKTIRI